MNGVKSRFPESARGRGRGRQSNHTVNLPSDPWSARTSSHASRDHGQKQEMSKISQNKESNALCKENHWKTKETASADRLDKANMIRKSNSENFSHILDESDSSNDEELKDEEILKHAMKKYKEEFTDNSDIPGSTQSLVDLLQTGATTCPVCIDPVKHLDAVWSCVKCYGVFHLQCIQRWAKQSVGAQKIASDMDEPEKDLFWCCPNCRNEYDQHECPTKYICFCGKEENPKFDPWSIPHSCGQECLKKLTPDCGHECLLLCHPGPCPPCPKTVKAKCYCGKKGPSLRRCSKKEWSCNGVCGKMLACGHHHCKNVCHAGECPACPEKGVQLCLCLKNKSIRSCAEPVWQCNETCGKLLMCGNHTCERTCHAEECGPCPRTGMRFCPCGKTSFQLPCTEDVVPCEDTCRKALECGRHYCHRRCHFGPCETCRQIVTKQCRCGRRSKEIPCCQVFTCEIKCSRIRNCGRHPCKRKCCDGNCPPCEQTCNRLLSCRNHKCPAQCHTGLCFPCPLKKDVKCFCGSTSISVKCGAERKTRPPRCKQICRIPPTCHHEKREVHHCHFGPCPTCKQICNLPLKSCDHVCAEPCHDHVFLEKPKKQLNLPVWERKPEAEEIRVPRPCAPCQQPQQRECYGKHEVVQLPCSQDKPFSCRRECGRELDCGNHKCQRECHVVIDAPTAHEAGKDCQVCEKHCMKPRPEGCNHDCKLPCHPGDCPKCSKFIRMKCHCELMMIDIKCCALTDGDTERLSIDRSCKNQCPRVLPCGHRCQESCHPGQCPNQDECKMKTKLQCSCKRRKKDYSCMQIRLEGITLECDEKCRSHREQKKKEEEKKAEISKAEELKKQMAELDQFEKKKQGRRRKYKSIAIEEQESLLRKYARWTFIPVAMVLISVFLYSLLMGK